MESTTSAVISAGDLRRANRRVGGAAVAAFLVLLLVGVLHRTAAADPVTPGTAPAATATIEPTQPLPARPYGEGGSAPGFDHDHDRGFGRRGGGDGGFRGGGGAPAAPSTGSGSQT